MSVSKCRSPTTSPANSSINEPVIEGSAFSHCWVKVALAVAIFAVVVGGGGYLLSHQGDSEDNTEPGNTGDVEEAKKKTTGLVFDIQAIGVDIDSSSWWRRRSKNSDMEVCKKAWGGKDRVDMLKTQFESLWKTKNLHIVEYDWHMDDPVVKQDIDECISTLGFKKYFKDIYVNPRAYTNTDSEFVDDVIKRTGRYSSKIYFITLSRNGKFLLGKNVDEIQVDSKIEVLNFQEYNDL